MFSISFSPTLFASSDACFLSKPPCHLAHQAPELGLSCVSFLFFFLRNAGIQHWRVPSVPTTETQSITQNSWHSSFLMSTIWPWIAEHVTEIVVTGFESLGVVEPVQCSWLTDLLCGIALCSFLKENENSLHCFKMHSASSMSYRLNTA